MPSPPKKKVEFLFTFVIIIYLLLYLHICPFRSRLIYFDRTLVTPLISIFTFLSRFKY